MKILFIYIILYLSLYAQNTNIAYNKNNIISAYNFYKAKNYKKASELLEYEIQVSPILKVEYFEMLANSYMYLKDYENMLKTTRSGIIVNRFSPKLYFQKGYALYKLGYTNSAIDAIRNSVALNPNDPYVNNYLGLLYLYSENYKLAEASFLRANIYSPDNVVYLMNLGATYERDKNFDNALRVYENIYSIDKNYRNIQESIKRVKGYLGYSNYTDDNNQINDDIYNYNEDTEVRPIEFVNTNENIDTNNNEEDNNN